MVAVDQSAEPVVIEQRYSRQYFHEELLLHLC